MIYKTKKESIYIEIRTKEALKRRSKKAEEGLLRDFDRSEDAKF